MDRKIILDFDRREKSRKHKAASSSSAGRSSSHSSSHSKHDKSHKHDRYDRDRKHKRPKQEPEEQSEPSTSSSYRDRARERREGINKDFELDPDDLFKAKPATSDDPESLDQEERRRQQIEESQYLGGDVGHTHLVKGLDFALLETIKAAEKLEGERRSKQTDERDLMLGASDSDDEEVMREAILATNATASNKRQLIDLDKLRSSDIIPCRTALARRILNAVDERLPERSEMYLPGRMSYIVPFDEESDSTVTTILRSKAEKQGGTDKTDAKELAFDQLINIFAKIRNKKSVRT